MGFIPRCDCGPNRLSSALPNVLTNIWTSSAHPPVHDPVTGELLIDQPTLRQQVAASSQNMAEIEQAARDVANSDNSSWWEFIIFNLMAESVRNHP